MSRHKFYAIIIAVFLTVLLHCSALRAAQTVPAAGVVIDSVSGKSMPYVNVRLSSGNAAALTDKKGRFNMGDVADNDTIIASVMGYEEVRIPATAFASGVRPRLLMQNKAVELQEVVVTRKREKYSKRNNPAVDLMQRIRASAHSRDPLAQPSYSYDKYQKIALALNDFHKEKAPWLAKRLNPIDDFIDTAHITGRPVLNVSFREKLSSVVHSIDPKVDKEVVRAFRSDGIDDALDQENIQIMLEDVLREIDIYSNDITLMQNRFVSPLSHIGADYYKYFMGDTITVDGTRYAELVFVPHNPESFSFNGSMYVDIDHDDAFVRSVSMRIPKAMNINFVDNIFVEQLYERDEMGNRRKVRDDMSVELQLVPGTQGFYAARVVDYMNHSYDAGPWLDFCRHGEGDTLHEHGWQQRGDDYWTQVRPAHVTDAQRSVSGLSARMDAVPLLLWLRKGLRLVVNGYCPVGDPSKLDIGPVNTFIGGNTVEGLRLRVGGMTTAALSPHWFTRAYVARGMKDHRWKYHGEVEYSFTPKKRHSYEFPMRSIRLEHTYDIDMIGQHYLFTNADNVFLAIKRKENNLATYRRLTQLTAFWEHPCGLTLQGGVRAERQSPSPWLPFVDGYGEAHRHYRQSALFFDVVYSPGASFVQTSSFRLPMNLDAWVLRLHQEWGPQGLLGSDFVVNKTELSVQKRFWFSSFGFVDILLKGGKMWSRVQYPALTWPNANLSYTVQPESWSLMNPMEFAMDTYASWDFTYWMNGLLFNRIPGFNMLKLREVVTFKGLWGALTKRNNPEYHADLFRFPADSHARPMGDTPYMEFGVGIDNILSILRVDYVWRLSYRHTTGAPDGGLRVALHFSF